MESTRLTDKTRTVKGIETLAEASDDLKHANPALSGVLYAIAGLPLETLAAIAAIVRLVLSNNKIVAQSVLDEVFENEICLAETDPQGGETWPVDVYYWNGISNALQIQEIATKAEQEVA